jgi:hypothetical protein
MKGVCLFARTWARTFGTRHLRSKKKYVLFFSNSDSNKPPKHRQSLGTGFGINLVRT